jgi:hypothetical protein
LRKALFGSIALLLSWTARAESVEVVPAEVLPARVERLDVDGLWRTRAFVVPRELPWHPGEVLTTEALELARYRLWGLGLFSRVDLQIVRDDDGRLRLRVVLEERWTTILIARFGAGGGVGWFATGLADINTLGRFIETGAFFHRFDSINGGEAWLRNPRFLDERQELALVVNSLGRPRNGFNVQRTAARVDYVRQVDETHWAGARVEFFADRFPQTPREFARVLLPSETLAASMVARLGRIDTDRHRMSGVSLEFRPLLGVTNDPGYFGYAQAWGELLAFRKVGSRWNFAARVQGGLQSPAPIQSRFYLGGLEQVRGYVDSSVRADRYFLVNLESRLVAFDSMFLALMPVVFVDAALAHTEQGTRPMLSLGVGLRGLIPRIYHSGARLDLAVVPEEGFRPRPVIGIFQFF